MIDGRPPSGWNLPGLLCSFIAIALVVACILGGVIWIISMAGGV